MNTKIHNVNICLTNIISSLGLYCIKPGTYSKTYTDHVLTTALVLSYQEQFLLNTDVGESLITDDAKQYAVLKVLVIYNLSEHILLLM
jgi:hypothetical protein